MTRFLTCAAAVIGLIGGTIAGWPEPRRVPASTDGVWAADFHVHAFLSDGVHTPFGIWWLARRRGLDVVAITNHNGVAGGRIGAWISRRLGPPIIIPGQEVTTTDAHILGIGIERTIDSRLGPGQVIAEIHRQGGIAIFAHPRVRTAQHVIDGGLRPDAMELRDEPSDRGAALVDAWTARRGERPIARVGGSDFHWGPTLGYRRTFVFAASPSEAAVVRAVAEGRVVGVDRRGALHGDQRLVRYLPPGIARHASDYQATGAWDAMTRLLGWLGIVGLTLFGSRRA